MSKSKVFVAGVGLSQQSSGGGAATLVSAATKALLDAGVTYDNVVKGVRSKQLRDGDKAFDSFGDDGVPVEQVAKGSELKSAFELVQKGKAACVLAIVADEKAAAGVVVVSEDFMLRWPYLKDSSVLATGSGGGSKASASELCQKVWELRGWNKSSSSGDIQGLKLSRADDQKAPAWKDVEHRQDGKHRLGYNPAQETREISQEDFEAVKATGKGRLQEGKSLFKREGGDREVLKKQLRYLAKL